jgi:hypothetical protein
MFMVLLAIRIREASNGAHRFKFYYQVVPQRVLMGVVALGLQLSDIVCEVESNSMHIGHDADFSSDSIATVALVNMIHYAYSRDGIDNS